MRDDAIINGGPRFPPVISPRKIPSTRPSNDGAGSSSALVLVGDGEGTSSAGNVPQAWELKFLAATFLTNTFLDEIRDNPNMDLKTFATKVQRKFNMCPNRWNLSRARKNALNIIHGDEDA